MENSFQTSFIPKKAILSEAAAGKSSTSFFTIIAIFVLVTTSVAAGVLFLYKNYLTKQKQVQSSSLLKVRDSFNNDTISDLELFDKRVSTAKQLLGSHIVFTPLFRLLGELTLPTVQYTRFTEDANGKAVSVKLSGVARDYKSIAVQASTFNGAKGRSFKNVVFSNLTKDTKTNYISFDLSFDVDPALLSYEKNNLIEQQAPKALPPTPPTSTQ